ncbi:MAG: tRNA (adenosine(37)-N6)-dimethylallyltransferase MiaA [Muribaculaceae bacterium]|nr:tRNA (adenosine(37)-N6)-dimethylallyltransferase MiaA [Muribaculaceae bacterium]
MDKTLIVITGPTGSGKTGLSIEVARRLGCEIISADSRQIYRDIPVGTAAPDEKELAAARHHFVGYLDLEEYYSAAQFEADVMALLPELFSRSDYAIMCGGSMMYVDAVVYGIDELPTISDDVRRRAYAILEREGLEGALRVLDSLDPEYGAVVDRNNHKRVVHAIEICMEAGRPYSSLRTGRRKPRGFRVVKFALDFGREELFDRINRRVELMVARGLADEARRVIDRRELNSLNTVGYKEMFKMLDGEWDMATAVARMQKNTRVFAKKQLTWLKKADDVVWLDPHGNDVAGDVIRRLI